MPATPENLRLVYHFENLYDGNHWIDVNIVDTLSAITAKTGAQKIEKLNSTNGLIFLRGTNSGL